MSLETRANLLGGEFCPAQRGARFTAVGGLAEDAWPQSSEADVSQAWDAARAAGADWARRSPFEREEFLCAMARALERDERLRARLAARFGLLDQSDALQLGRHFVDLERDVLGLRAPAGARASGVAWCAPDWRDLVRAPLLDLARELVAGRTAVLLSDARLPELGQQLALAAQAASLPAGVLGLLHGATRELLALAIGGPQAEGEWSLVASGLADGLVDLRRLEARGAACARLRALRCGVVEVAADAALETTAGELVERAFGSATTLGGQLPGALGRIFCPARTFARFSELFLARLEASRATERPVPLCDGDARARTLAAWELGLDEGATCIAGGEESADARTLPPTVFTNVEPGMASARRQDPLPVLCLLRGP